MNHSENDKRFCVYVHKDNEGNVVYIGSGNYKRPYSVSNRSEEHRLEWKNLSVIIIEDGLSKIDSLKKEQHLLDTLGCPKFNRSKTVTIPKIVKYDLVSRYVYYDGTSPTFLRWVHTHSAANFKRVKDYPAGYEIKSKGYMYVGIEGRRYPIHRIVICLLNRKDVPENVIVDHIDRNGLNNNFNNLRFATPQENQRNISVRKDSTTGVTGVLLKRDTFFAEWQENGKRVSLSFPITKFMDNCDFDTAKLNAFNTASRYRELKTLTLYFGNTDKKLYEEINEIVSTLRSKFKSKSLSGYKCVFWNKQLSKWYVSWKDGDTNKTKCFNPKVLFPHLSFEEAKEKSFDLAVEFRKQKQKELNQDNTA